MTTARHHHPAHPDDHTVSHRRFLDLDADVFGDQLGAVLDTVGAVTPRHVVDVGAGSGAGSRVLRRRYPDAAITCLDRDPQMLGTLRDQGFNALEVDLDEGFPTAPAASTPPPDLVWMASSLHHITDPGRLLATTARVMDPSGTLVVVELAGFPRFLTGTPAEDLETRCHDAAAAAGWNHHPDWTRDIEAAGFQVRKQQLTATAPDTPAAREYAQQWLTRFVSLDDLDDADRAALHDLLPRVSAERPIAPRAVRTAWTGVLRPA